MLGWLTASAERSLVGWASACVPLGSECPIRESPKLARAPRRCWLGPRPTRMGGHGLGTARGLGNTRGATTTKAAMSDDPSSVAWSVREGGGLGQRMSQGATVECGHQSIDSHAWPHECRPGARGSIDAIGRCAGRGQRKPAPWSRRVCAASSACFTRANEAEARQNWRSCDGPPPHQSIKHPTAIQTPCTTHGIDSIEASPTH